MQASARWLRQGVSMVFFPEGTRSEDGRLKEFKLGAFRLAMDEKVDILPLVLRGTRDMVQKKSGMPRPARLEIEVLSRVSPKPGESLESFGERVREIIALRLEQGEAGAKPQREASPELSRSNKPPISSY